MRVQEEYAAAYKYRALAYDKIGEKAKAAGDRKKFAQLNKNR